MIFTIEFDLTHKYFRWKKNIGTTQYIPIISYCSNIHLQFVNAKRNKNESAASQQRQS